MIVLAVISAGAFVLYWALVGRRAKAKKIEDAIEICKYEIKNVPKLIPIFSHRYIPSQPHEACNPIFSVYQTDIVYYGENLTSYLKLEFKIEGYREVDSRAAIKEIRFWPKIM